MITSFRRISPCPRNVTAVSTQFPTIHVAPWRGATRRLTPDRKLAEIYHRRIDRIASNQISRGEKKIKCACVRYLVFSRDSDPTSCGSPASHLPLLFICHPGSRYTRSTRIYRGNPWNRVAPTTPPRPTPLLPISLEWKFQLVIADRSITCARVRPTGRIHSATFPLPPSLFSFFLSVRQNEKLVSRRVHRRNRLPRGSSSPLLRTEAEGNRFRVHFSPIRK